MKPSTLNNIQHIVEYMNDIGWTEKVHKLCPFEEEMKSYCEAISSAFIELSVLSFNVAEAKYMGYVELVDNMEQPELQDSVLKKHLLIIQDKENERKDVEYRISELMFLLEDLRDNIIGMGNLPQIVSFNHEEKKSPEEKYA